MSAAAERGQMCVHEVRSSQLPFTFWSISFLTLLYGGACARREVSFSEYLARGRCQ